MLPPHSTATSSAQTRDAAKVKRCRRDRRKAREKLFIRECSVASNPLASEPGAPAKLVRRVAFHISYFKFEVSDFPGFSSSDVANRRRISKVDHRGVSMLADGNRGREPTCRQRQHPLRWP